MGIGFLDRQRRLKDPFIDIRLFRVPAFSASLSVNTLGIFALFGIFVFMSQYLQLVAGLSPFQAGLWTLPGAVAFVIGSNTAPMIVQRVRPAYVVSAGFVLAAFGIVLATQAGTDSLALVIASWTIVSIGMAPAFTVTSDMIMTAAPPERAGSAAAMSETGNELGGALGIAVIGSIGTAIYRSHIESGMPAGVPAESAHNAQDTLGGALSVAAQLPSEAGDALLHAAQSAFVDGLQATAAIGAVLIVLTAGVAVTLLRHMRPSAAHASHGEPAPEAVEIDTVTEPAPAGMD
jgi:DHA2 family multidrug resistance protein-like MFS transporter